MMSTPRSAGSESDDVATMSDFAAAVNDLEAIVDGWQPPTTTDGDEQEEGYKALVTALRAARTECDELRATVHGVGGIRDRLEGLDAYLVRRGHVERPGATEEADERTIKKILDDVEAMCESLCDQLTAANAALDATRQQNSQSASELQKQLQAAVDRAAAAEAALEESEVEAAAASGRCAAREREIAALETSLATAEQQVASLQQTVDAGHSDTDAAQRMEALQATLESERQLSTLKLDAELSKCQLLETQLAKACQRAEEAESRMADSAAKHDHALAELTSQLTTAQLNLAEVRQDAEGRPDGESDGTGEGDDARASATAAVLNRRLVELAGQVASLKQELAVGQAREADLQSQLQQLQQEQRQQPQRTPATQSDSAQGTTAPHGEEGGAGAGGSAREQALEAEVVELGKLVMQADDTIAKLEERWRGKEDAALGKAAAAAARAADMERQMQVATSAQEQLQQALHDANLKLTALGHAPQPSQTRSSASGGTAPLYEGLTLLAGHSHSRTMLPPSVAASFHLAPTPERAVPTPSGGVPGRVALTPSGATGRQPQRDSIVQRLRFPASVAPAPPSHPPTPPSSAPPVPPMATTTPDRGVASQVLGELGAQSVMRRRHLVQPSGRDGQRTGGTLSSSSTDAGDAGVVTCSMASMQRMLLHVASYAHECGPIVELGTCMLKGTDGTYEVMAVDTALRALFCYLIVRSGSGAHTPSVSSGLSVSRIRRFTRDCGMAVADAGGSRLSASKHETPLRVVDVEVACAARAKAAVPGQALPPSRRLSYAAFCLVAVDLAQRLFPRVPSARRLPALTCQYVVPWLCSRAALLPFPAARPSTRPLDGGDAPPSPSSAHAATTLSSWPHPQRAHDRSPHVVYAHHRGRIVRRRNV